ncbi:methyltransferase [Hirsutella rhossiliensis]
MPVESQAPGDPGDDEETRPQPGLQSFPFTFDCSTIGGAPSFIEADIADELWDDSASLSESVQTFPEEFGRTYHAYRAGVYAFPNDNTEQERLALQGQILKALFGDSLYLAPLSKSRPPRNILDIATGIGDWAIEMGDAFPDSQIIATDLSPIQPLEVPPNVNFFVEDSSDPWIYSQSFDYIHTRSTGGCWTSFQTQIAEQAFTALNPGGWFESQAVIFPMHSAEDSRTANANPILKWISSR